MCYFTGDTKTSPQAKKIPLTGTLIFRSHMKTKQTIIQPFCLFAFGIAINCKYFSAESQNAKNHNYKLAYLGLYTRKYIDCAMTNF